jgi:peptidoglycan/LPS O-acetylase OafA/YrhL
LSFRLTGADGLRAIACLAVITHHLTQRLAMQKQPHWIQEIQSVLLLGDSGVSVFFVLSGFLLSFPFWQNYLTQAQFPSMKTYMLRRAARIMPGFYTSLLVCSILVLALHIPSQHFWMRLLSGFTFTAEFHYVTFFPTEINGPLWSIGFEVFCYVLMPVMMFGLFRLFGKNRSFRSALFYWLGVMIVLYLSNELIHKYLTPDNIKRGWQYGLIGGAKIWMPNFNPIGLFAHFCIGNVCAGIAAKLRNTPHHVIEKIRKMGAFDYICALCLLSSVVLLWMMRHKSETAMSLQHQPYYFPLYAILMGGILSSAPYSNLVGNLLDNRFFRFTAKVSFGLYIWHSLIIWIVSTYWIKHYQFMRMSSLSEWVFVSIIIIVSAYVAGTLSYYLIEKPVLDWVHGKTGNKKIIASPM